MITTQNIFLSASFFNSSNNAVAKTLATSNTITDYFALGDVNISLSQENAILRQRIKNYQQSLYRLDTRVIKDADLIGQYEFVSAKIINNNTRLIHNHITINIGEKQGMEKGLGVVNQYGIVGKLASVSSNYAVVSSLLNADMMISSKIKRTGHLGTVNWSGENSQIANLLYIPRHVTPVVGDTIITSGYNAVFPEGVMIGTVGRITLAEEANFYAVEVELANDYSKLSHVYVIKNNLKEEQQSIEQPVTESND